MQNFDQNLKVMGPRLEHRKPTSLSVADSSQGSAETSPVSCLASLSGSFLSAYQPLFSLIIIVFTFIYLFILTQMTMPLSSVLVWVCFLFQSAIEEAHTKAKGEMEFVGAN